MERRVQMYTALLYCTLLLTEKCCSRKMALFKTLEDGSNPELAPYLVGVKAVSGYVPCAVYCLNPTCPAFFYDQGNSSCQLYSKIMSAEGTANGKLFYVVPPPQCEHGQPSDGCLSNVALGKMVSTSSQSHDIAPPSLLVDNETNQSWPCTRTNTEENPWLLVDLGQSFNVWELQLYNRLDCCSFHLLNVVLSLGPDAGSLQDVYYHDGEVTDDVLVVQFDIFVPAQFVKVTLNGTKPHILSLCEMTVFGQP